ncbi:MAG TPA: beta-propeller fold lactonase family protein [Candidatus Dormibacteraeota bacterium]|nr:beta-propeller fold lactonase family protein [Candidatus Dormibacteraeota bacterium]
MHLRKRIVASAGMAALAAAAALSVSSPALASDDVLHVYVNDNTAGTNTIAAFNRHADGSLTPSAGSPFAAGGAGTGTIIGSQGALQVTGDGRYLLAVDAGSSQISVLRIRDDGSLRQVEGSPVSSGGIEPVSIAVHEGLVYVANEGNGVTGSNYTGFRLSGGGRLTPISGSTFTLPNTANPGDILFNSTGNKVVGVEVGTTVASTFRIDSFVVGHDGLLTQAPGSPFLAQAPGPFGSEFSPTNPSHLYVSNAHGGGGNGSVSAFRVAKNGVLSSIGGSPYPDGQTAPCWVEISRDGRYLFTVNTGSTSISSYRIHADGSLTLRSTATFSSGGGIRPFDARLDPSGSHLYVVDAALKAVTAFAVDGGSLSELSTPPFALPTNATPFGIVVA